MPFILVGATAVVFLAAIVVIVVLFVLPKPEPTPTAVADGGGVLTSPTIAPTPTAAPASPMSSPFAPPTPTPHTVVVPPTTRPRTPPPPTPREVVPETPTPRPPVAEETSMLQVTVTPPAQVTVDGEPRGTSPLRLRLKPGKHAIVVAHPDFLPLHRTITLKPGDQNRPLQIDLTWDGVRK